MNSLPLHITADTGAGPLGLWPVAGATGFYRLFGTGGDCMFLYTITQPATGAFETGAGHLKDAATLVRDRIISSSNHGRAVDFPPGVKIIRNHIARGAADRTGAPA